jgi:hypothetical protein
LDAGAISSYPGAATPVSGWWLPIVIVLAVMPGAEAVSAAPDEEEPALGLELGVEVLLEPQAATPIATTAIPATSGRLARCVFLMWCLPPVSHWPARAGARR